VCSTCSGYRQYLHCTARPYLGINCYHARQARSQVVAMWASQPQCNKSHGELHCILAACVLIHAAGHDDNVDPSGPGRLPLQLACTPNSGGSEAPTSKHCPAMIAAVSLLMLQTCTNRPFSLEKSAMLLAFLSLISAAATPSAFAMSSIVSPETPLYR
jgi:hypothetical protein